jgi:hypothetical protein
MKEFATSTLSRSSPKFRMPSKFCRKQNESCTLRHPSSLQMTMVRLTFPQPKAIDLYSREGCFVGAERQVENRQAGKERIDRATGRHRTQKPEDG